MQALAALPPLRPGALQLPALWAAVPRLEAHVARDRAAARDAAAFAAKLAKVADWPRGGGAEEQPYDVEGLAQLLEVILAFRVSPTVNTLLVSSW